MPKYYVQDQDQAWIIDAQSPRFACVKGLYYGIIDTIPMNDKNEIAGDYLISEKGFDDPRGLTYPIRLAVKRCLELKEE